MPHKKLHLPQKICLSCGRPFSWRKKWERDWEAVKYCSDRCRRAGPAGAGAEVPAAEPARGRRR